MNKYRTKSVTFRMSEDEFLAMKQLVNESGFSQNEFICRAVLGQKIIQKDTLSELFLQLKRLGNNLNQIAKSLNGRGYYDYNLITENQKELRKIWQQLNSLTAKRNHSAVKSNTSPTQKKQTKI